MNINLTLFGSPSAFAVFVWFCMKFVWPPIMGALRRAQEEIADGLAAAERGRHEQELAQKRAAEVLHEAKQQAQEIIKRRESAPRRSSTRPRPTPRAKASASWLRPAPRSARRSIARRKACVPRWCPSPSPAPARSWRREVDANTHNDLLNKLAAQI
jgi:F-type H+-transporting ATPase subunit b